MSRKLRLTVDCPDQIGLAYQTSNFIAQNSATIVEANHHTDIEQKRFYMRYEIEHSSASSDLKPLQQKFAEIADKYAMSWSLSDASIKKKLVLLATKDSHCLLDILHRWHCGELDCEIPCIIANHPEMKQFADWFSIPFHYVDFKGQAKSAAFAEIERLISSYQADVIGLARFMQILPEPFCQRYANRIINIHHSFLPSFAGAKPYHRAHERGVKLIGATCHYVTSDLDEGPIIEQEVLRINHSDSIQDMIRKGKECEKMAFAKGIGYHLEDRVVVFKNKTIVFC